MFKMKTKKQVKRKNKTMLNDTNEGTRDDEEESLFLSHLITFEDLTSEHKIMCDSDNCNLQAWLIYVGNNVSMEWNTCVDCILREHDNWPTEEHCDEVNV